jgi:hypothetical protein
VSLQLKNLVVRTKRKIDKSIFDKIILSKIIITKTKFNSVQKTITKFNVIIIFLSFSVYPLDQKSGKIK